MSKFPRSEIFKGEIITFRRDNLDFTLPLGKMLTGMRENLPKHSYKETIDHYNKKLRKVFCNIAKRERYK